MSSAASTTDLAPLQPSLALRIGLWVAQTLLFLLFCFAGVTKVFTPIKELAQMMPWAGEYSVAFVRTIGLIDLAGGLGILLPSLTRVVPRLTVLAAIGCATLQVFAFAFHLSRGEGAVTPLNILLLALSLFVLWGRNSKAPIAPRG
ncbi:membrane protein [Bradyrhizobium sp. SSBR45G]|uniref:DoxX family protein n=1 Tax=unclassified Bradyrhizobium TaxID=2631580 RepID=UPI002342A205|nr:MULTISPECIES: DoxX family protein [unclassified Bradyrhizobium]GLH81010.1 membrane protein [Bradyrhizobium sp. SSBR45G]GLH88295.1 membrane protein [Bradyrhizobium sp. SSBR45R]